MFKALVQHHMLCTAPCFAQSWAAEETALALQVKGNKVYSKLKFESGVHRVQRVPATESSGRVHTSTATVAIMPEVGATHLPSCVWLKEMVASCLHQSVRLLQSPMHCEGICADLTVDQLLIAAVPPLLPTMQLPAQCHRSKTPVCDGRWTTWTCR